MCLIAFIANTAEVRKILEHIGVDSAPPRITPARGPPLWDNCDALADEMLEALSGRVVPAIRQENQKWHMSGEAGRSIARLRIAMCKNGILRMVQDTILGVVRLDFLSAGAILLASIVIGIGRLQS